MLHFLRNDRQLHTDNRFLRVHTSNFPRYILLINRLSRFDATQNIARVHRVGERRSNSATRASSNRLAKSQGDTSNRRRCFLPWVHGDLMYAHEGASRALDARGSLTNVIIIRREPLVAMRTNVPRESCNQLGVTPSILTRDTVNWEERWERRHVFFLTHRPIARTTANCAFLIPLRQAKQTSDHEARCVDAKNAPFHWLSRVHEFETMARYSHGIPNKRNSAIVRGRLSSAPIKTELLLCE